MYKKADPEEMAMKKKLQKAMDKDMGNEPEEYDDATDSYPGKPNGPAGEGGPLMAALKAAKADGMTADQLHQMVSKVCGAE
jgi:hypothetical protein